MNRMVSRRRGIGLAVLLLGATVLAGCEDLLFEEPAPAITRLELSFDVARPATSGAGIQAALVYDQVRVQLLNQTQGTVQEETVSFTPSDNEVRVEFTVDLEEATATYLIRVDLLEGGATIGTGSAAVQIQRGSVTPVNVDIDESGRVVLLPEQREGQTRIVLTWGESPRDLDSHLIGPDGQGTTFEVYFGNRGSLDQPPYVVLDTDDTSSFGPETITIDRQFDGTYCYYVYQYSSDGALATSEAQVDVYQNNTQVASYAVPTSGTGRYWSVFTLNGETIEDINTIVDTAPACQ